MSQKWIVEFTVADLWIADGFNLTRDQAKQMLQDELGWAHPHEIDAQIISSPRPDTIEMLQNGTLEYQEEEKV